MVVIAGVIGLIYLTGGIRKIKNKNKNKNYES